MKRFWPVFVCLGLLWWTLPAENWQEMTTYLFEADTNVAQPSDWRHIATVPYGETMWVGHVRPNKYYGGFFLYKGLESNWDSVKCLPGKGRK